ncbi:MULTISPECIES: DUF2626 domain-containing protein [Paenibacillus]|uniref:DUF2626 domain-containing protein n=1 Tax=Paenibacillus TaxID=44249 RepID=UPI00203E75B5|nr:DUF2626 domain-containing protein [Paenibacillus camelliae]MCM3632254.1 DUF2626 domain-containing protein [Paenibacillus camelliae]
MARMYRVLGFWCLVIGLMAYAGHMYEFSLLFLAQAAAFVFLGYLKFSEKTYIAMFWGYMVISFVGFTYWSVFKMSIPF